MKPIDPRRWARPGDLLRATRSLLVKEDVLYAGTLAVVVEAGPPSAEFNGWLEMKMLIEGRILSVQSSRHYWEHVNAAG